MVQMSCYEKISEEKGISPHSSNKKEWYFLHREQKTHSKERDEQIKAAAKKEAKPTNKQASKQAFSMRQITVQVSRMLL